MGIAIALLLLCAGVQIWCYKQKKLKRANIKNIVSVENSPSNYEEAIENPPPYNELYRLPPPPDFGRSIFTPNNAENGPKSYDIFIASQVELKKQQEAPLTAILRNEGTYSPPH